MEFVRFVQDEDADEDAADRPPQEPEELIDAWLLEAFPGRTLEELDQIDLNRLMRAKSARSMELVEARRRLFLAGKLEPTALSREEWRLIVAMDALVS